LTIDGHASLAAISGVVKRASRLRYATTLEITLILLRSSNRTPIAMSETVANPRVSHSLSQNGAVGGHSIELLKRHPLLSDE
jgi:hypothetical protein